ncbi:MAG: histidine--tRNA ligase [Bacteroidetes bacterium]|nr:histidine--tRNA ligase [Bacteroidota bacterium]
MKPSIPKGTRDFGPAEMQKRQYILDIIRNNFELFGYQPIETPSMENITTLTGKYGEEGDQLIFKILNSRIHESKNKDLLKKEFDLSLESSRNSEELTEKALRYDLTVPFARYVVMNQHNLSFPFKRYQIQPVWRADRPQKGRYREFYQCDADVIGSDSLINELDLISLMDKSFRELSVPVILKFNNRKILTALAQVINEPSKIIDITVAIDKLDKVGKDGVNKELIEKGISAKAIETLQPLLDFKGDNKQKVEVLRKLVGTNDEGKKGIEEIEYLLNNLNVSYAKIELDITLARGLNYYTGTIFEVKANAGTFTPSILGGGRYDDLTGIFGLKNMSGVGISFGIDRIYDVMEELNLFPDHISKVSSTKLLFTHFDLETQKHCLKLAARLRENNISCEVYPDVTKKLGKQFEYADKKNIPFVCTVGSDEIASQTYAFKNMASGEQKKLSLNEIIDELNTSRNDF